MLFTGEYNHGKMNTDRRKGSERGFSNIRSDVGYATHPNPLPGKKSRKTCFCETNSPVKWRYMNVFGMRWLEFGEVIGVEDAGTKVLARPAARWATAPYQILREARGDERNMPFYETNPFQIRGLFYVFPIFTDTYDVCSGVCKWVRFPERTHFSGPTGPIPAPYS